MMASYMILNILFSTATRSLLETSVYFKGNRKFLLTTSHFNINVYYISNSIKGTYSLPSGNSLFFFTLDEDVDGNLKKENGTNKSI